MKMWIGCLASYNNGRLFGEWVDISTDAEDNADAITALLARSPVKGAEEAFIADYEAPKGIADTLGEYPSAKALAAAATLVEAVEAQWPDSDDVDAVLGVMMDGARSGDLERLADDVADWISDRVAGEGDTLQDWCANFLDETGFFGIEGLKDRPEIERYFDFESYARDLELGGDISSVRSNGRVLVFWNRSSSPSNLIAKDSTMPLYSDNAPKGYMGDPKRGAALGRVDIGSEIVADLFRKVAERRKALAHYATLSPTVSGLAERVAQVTADLARLESDLAELPPRLASPKITLRRVRLDRGGYDDCGAYWGIGAPLYWASDESGEFDSTFRADSRNWAKYVVRETFPNARFYN